MREFKFRYWDTFDGENKMIYFNFGMVSGGKVYPNMETTMQYTGLKDKNGKEIYEGDTIRYLSGGNYYESKVFYGEDCGCYLVEEPTVMLLDHAKRHSEIIGNIYQVL